jgi:hypothetical protein
MNYNRTKKNKRTKKLQKTKITKKTKRTKYNGGGDCYTGAKTTQLMKKAIPDVSKYFDPKRLCNFKDYSGQIQELIDVIKAYLAFKIKPFDQNTTKDILDLKYDIEALNNILQKINNKKINKEKIKLLYINYQNASNFNTTNCGEIRTNLSNFNPRVNFFGNRNDNDNDNDTDNDCNLLTM